METKLMFKLLIDTSVWLELAKNHKQASLLETLEFLVREGQVSFILPRTIVNEFERNKARIIEESSRSLSSSLKRAKEIVDMLGEGKSKRLALEQLNDADYRLPQLGETAVTSIGRIESLFATSQIIETSDAVLLRAGQRAIERRAPFHRQRNSIEDAILIEWKKKLFLSKIIPAAQFKRIFGKVRLNQRNASRKNMVRKILVLGLNSSGACSTASYPRLDGC
jgi:hypothetical protein